MMILITLLAGTLIVVTILYVRDLKKAHARELNRVISENQRLWDELTKVRYVETPALQRIQIGEDKTPPPTPSEDLGGLTPWERVRAKYIKEQEMQATRRYTTPAVSPDEAGGTTDGSVREGRIETPQRQPS
jgi:hypothetical protein